MKRKKRATSQEPEDFEDFQDFDDEEQSSKETRGILSQMKLEIWCLVHDLEDQDEADARRVVDEMFRWMDRQAPALSALYQLECEVERLKRELWQGFGIKVARVVQSPGSAARARLAQRIARAVEVPTRVDISA
jgi:hypothetical protein